MTADPFEMLPADAEPIAPRTEFRRELRGRLVDRLDLALNTVSLPDRKTRTMTNTTATTTDTSGASATATAQTAIIPYLAVHDGRAALAFYAEAFGAVEMSRFDMDGRLGHAEFVIGGTTFYLADEFPEIGAHAPTSLDGTTVTLHLTVPDVDAAFAAAVAAGATAQMEPTDQPHGNRTATLFDPFSHRWMLSQPQETTPAPATRRDRGGIWAGVHCRDAQAIIRLAIDVFGFEEDIVVADGDRVIHSQIVGPGGGTVSIVSAERGGPYHHITPGSGNIYVVTPTPDEIYQRSLEAGLEVVAEPYTPDYDPEGSAFAVRDGEGNIWSFGTYAG